jgi:septal ring factor EnvC (AmiA/AmiB activator)
VLFCICLADKNMVTFTREDRRGRVLELHSQGMGTREIAKQLHMSFTDIGKILKDSDKEKESEQQRTRQEFLSSQAYTLFSEGKSPVQVAIELNIRASEAIIFQREYWELEGLHNLNQIYQEIKGGTWHFVNLWKSVKAAGMGVPHVNRLLTIANNDLPSVESRYERLKKEAATLEYEKENSAREFQQVNNQIIMMRKTLDSTRLDYEKEMERLRHLQQEIMKQEALVKHFGPIWIFIIS